MEFEFFSCFKEAISASLISTDKYKWQKLCAFTITTVYSPQLNMYVHPTAKSNATVHITSPASGYTKIMGRKEKRRLNRLINRINTEEAQAPEVLRLQTEDFHYNKSDPTFPRKQPQVSELQSLKEEFLEILNSIFTKYERSMTLVVFKRCSPPAVLTIISSDQKVHIIGQLRRSFDIDGSSEMKAILLKRSRLFLDRTVGMMRAGDEEQRKNIMTAATQLVKVLSKELDLSTRILFEKDNPNAVTFERFIATEFRKCIPAYITAKLPNKQVKKAEVASDNRSLEDLLSDIIDDTIGKKPTKKKPQQKTTKEEVLPEDREFEDFRAKLESMKTAKVRVKPRICDQWMTHLFQQADLIRAESCK